MLRIHQYRKAYDGTDVLKIDNLHLPKGIYWLKGENGSGKTTLLKSIAGLIPFEGQISVCDLDLRKQRRQYTRQVSFAGAEPVFPSFLTGSELLRFYLRTKGGNEAELGQMAAALGVTTYLPGKIATYSSGMLKKLSLLLSFAGTPDLVLLDEPLITLDEKAVNALRDQIAQSSENGVSFLISSHQKLDLTKSVHHLQIHKGTLKTENHVAPAE